MSQPQDFFNLASTETIQANLAFIRYERHDDYAGDGFISLAQKPS